MRIHVLALDGVFDLGLASLVDTLTLASELAAASGRPGPRFEVTVVGVRRRIRTQQGLAVPVTSVGRARPPDAVVVAAMGAKTPDTIGPALARPDVADAGAALRAWGAEGATVGAACTGTFVLGASGLLDGRAATTSWWLAPYFRERFPGVELDDSRMIVPSGRVVTAGAALGHVELALWFVHRQSPTLSALTARYLVVDRHPTQAAYALPAQLAHTDPIVERFEKWAHKHLAERFSLVEAAHAAGASARTLARRLQTVLGRTPLTYVQDLRVERATHLLETTDASADEIATKVGYEDGATLRALLRRKTGRGVRELRRARTG